jgi:hypothetical protein
MAKSRFLKAASQAAFLSAIYDFAPCAKTGLGETIPTVKNATANTQGNKLRKDDI